MYLANVKIEKSPTVRVEKATSDLLTGPDWTMNIGICDTINTDLGQAKEMVKAVKRRLQNKNPKIQLLALTQRKLLETMVKNCGEEVHLQIVSRNILQEMVKIVKKKTDMHVRDKILVLLDSWQEAFGGPRGKYPQFYWAYDELRQSGVEFPQRSADAAPIFTPPATHPIVRHRLPGYGMPNDATRRLDQVMASEISSSNLDSMKNAMDLLSDMLHAMNSNDHEGANEVVMDLVQQCKANQKKLEQMISLTNDEELLGKGLELNDCLQNLLAKHHAISTGTAPAKAGTSGQTSSIPSVSGPTHFKTEPSDIEDEDDEFTQLARRRAKTSITASQTTQIGSVASSSINGANTSTTGQSPSTSSVPSILSLPNPPSSISTSTKEHDMIDLLSITLSESTSPHTPQPHSPSFSTPIQTTQISSPSPIQQYPYNPQYYLPNQGQTTYIVPWAQPQSPYPLQQYTTQYTLNYPPPPWATMPSSGTVTHPTTHPNYTTTYTPTQSPRQLQQYNSMGSRGNHAVKGTNVQTGSQARQLDRQYVSSNRLFEDLIDLKGINNGFSTSGATMSLSGSTGQGVVGGGSK